MKPDGGFVLVPGRPVDPDTESAQELDKWIAKDNARKTERN
jgi:hypothetical protein